MLTRWLLSICVSVALSSAAWAQTLVVHKNANLRAKPTTQSQVLDHLEPGDELTRVSDAKQNRFWNVETADGTRGWIYDTLVHFEDEEEEEDDPVDPPALTLFDEFDETWPKPTPTGSLLTGPAGFSPAKCPASGESGGDTFTTRGRTARTCPRPTRRSRSTRS